MKKSKLITTLLLLVVLLVAFSTVFAACKPKDDDPNSGIGSGSMPPPPNNNGNGDDGEQQVYYTPLEFLEKIIGSIDTPEKVLGIDVSIDCDTPDGKKTKVAFKTNIKDKYNNEISLIVHQQAAGETGYERVFGIYMVNDKMYVDLGEGKSTLYLEDFNPNYIIELVQKGILKIPELLGGIDIMSYVNTFLPLIMPILFADPIAITTEAGGQDITMDFDIKGLLEAVPDILSSFVKLPVDLGVIIGYIAGLMPTGTYQLQSNFDVDGNRTYLGITVDDVVSGDHTNLEVNLDIKDSAVDTQIPEIDENNLVNFSFTNIQFSIDLTVGTQLEPKLDENGDPVMENGKPVMQEKRLDVGKVINELLGGTGILPQDFNLPSGLLLLEGGTGLRLSFAIDLDLNYKQEPVDNNKIAIELYLLDRNGKQVETRPQAGIYYTQGSLYINLDSLLPNYMQNINLRVDTNLSTLVSALVSMITDTIDETLGTDFRDIVDNSGATVGSDGTVTVNSQEDLERILSTANVDVLACATDDNGRYVISPGIKDFVNVLAKLVGFQECIEIEGSRITIIAENERFLSALAELMGKQDANELGFKFPSAIPEVKLNINLFEGGLESISVDATVDSVLDVEVKIHSFLIGIEDTNLEDRIKDGINKENTSYLNSLSSVVDTILSGIILRTHFKMTFNEGRYNLAPFIASFGLPQIADTDIIWEFTDEFVLDASINIQIALNRENPMESTFLFELKTDEGIIIGKGEEGIKFAPGTVLIGIYGYRNSVYIDLSQFKIANITLPKLKFDLRFSDVVFSLIDDMIAKLLTSMNIEGGDLIFNFDLGDLIGLPTAPATDGAIATADGDGTTTAPSLKQELAAIVLGVSTDSITPFISMASILAVIKQIDSKLIDESLNETLELMEVNLKTSMGRKDGFEFEFTGNLIPIMIDYEEDENGVTKDSICVFYYDKDGKQLPTHDANGKRIVYINDKDNKQYAYKRYNYINKNGVDSGFFLRFEAGTEKFPIVIGEIPAKDKFDFATKAKEFDQYKSDLIDAIMDTVGTGELDLTLRLLTKDNKMDLTQMINTILASVGKKLDIPINLNLDEWETDVKLLLQWDIDFTSSARSAIRLELQYRGKIIMGVYVYRNNFIINLEGLGLFSAEITNTGIVEKIFTMLAGYVEQIEGFDLNNIIADLLEQAGLPTLPGAGSEDDEVATDDNMPTIGENLQVMDLVKYLLQAVSLEDTSIALNFTSTLINTLLNELLGINLGIDFTLNGNLDLFGNEFGIDIGVQDIEVKATLALNIGGEVDIRVDYENIPDWNAIDGRTLAKTMLDNIDLGLTLDLANNTSDARAVQGGKPGYTRIKIWKAGNNDRLTGTADNMRVTKGNIIVGVYQIDETLFNDNTANVTPKYVAYLVLDYNAGKMYLTLAKGLITLGPAIDIGNYVKNMALDLDLLGMLSEMFGDLLDQVGGIFDNLNTQSAQQLATADGDGNGDGNGQQNGFAALFADFDIVKLLSAGIEVSLKSNGNFNVDIAFDPYTINKLIDDVLGAIFSRKSGKESLLNLAKLASDMFTKDHLANVTWDRMVPGANGNLDSFWGSFRATVPDLLTDVVKGLGININIGALDGLLDGIYNQVSVLIRSLLPFAVFNEFHVGLNVVDATIANLSVVGLDHNQVIYDDEGNPVYGDSEARSADNFSQIWIYNMFKSVGDPSNALPGVSGENAKGVVTWTDIPSRIDYAPYTYESDTAGVDEIIKKYFTNKTARYQDGASGVIIKKDVSFYFTKYRYDDNSEWMNNPENTPVTKLDLSLKGTYIVEARATFDGMNKKMEITINALGDGGGGVVRADSFSMHVYDPLPDFISVRMKDDSIRKIRIDDGSGGVQILNKDGTGPVMPEKYGENHTVDALVRFPRQGQADLPIKVEYLDSTVDKVIVNGEAIDAQDGKVASIIIDLYNYKLSKESSITDYISDVFYFKYKDGKAVGLDVNGEWEYDPEEVAKFYERVVGEDGFSEDVSGTAFAVRNTVGSGPTEQEVKLMIWVKTKKVNKLTIAGLENTLRVDPYQYYMYLYYMDQYESVIIDMEHDSESVIREKTEMKAELKAKADSINPFPTTATATYYDSYNSPIKEGETIIDNGVEDVYIRWNEEDYKTVDFSWNNNNSGGKDDVWVYLDNSKYDGNFTWKFQTRIVVLRNEIQAVYFDDELTQSTYFIDPFDYLLKKSHGMTDKEIYPSEANILFTNGSVRKMPIQWVGLDKFEITDYSSRVAQLQVKIGFDINNMLEGKVGLDTDLEQTAYVNVRVEDLTPDGLDVAGSEYSIKNKGEATFYIDPIQVLYYGMDPFPKTVDMVYKGGKTTALEVDWDFDYQLITMQGRKGLTATVVISDEYRYPINVEIIDRTNLKAATGNITIDPYKYTVDENGSRVYTNFTSKSYIYKLVGNINYEDINNLKVEGLNKVSGKVSDEFNTYVQYEVEYIKNAKQEVYTARDIDLIADFLEREGKNITVLSAVAKEYFEVNVDWDLTEINYAISDTYTVKMISKALDEKYDRTFRINVEVVAKKVSYVGREDYYINIDLKGANLTEEEVLTKTLSRNLYVMFDQGGENESYGNYDCTIDLNGVNFDYYHVMSVKEFEVDGVKYNYRDRSGNPVADVDVAKQGTDVTVTVCSGDIAQRVTIKAVVIYNDTQTA